MSNLPGDKNQAKATAQMSLGLPKAATKSPSSKPMTGAPSAEPSIDDEYVEEDLTQRKKLILNGAKSKEGNKGDDLSHVTGPKKELKKLEEKGQETTDNYDDYNNESDNEKKDASKNLQKTVEKVKMSSESSKMIDSHAKNSEEYESDFFDENT
jgi:hypothetical protein